MDELYQDEQFIQNTMSVLEEQAKDMGNISVYNDDFLNDEIVELDDIVARIKNKIKEK